VAAAGMMYAVLMLSPVLSLTPMPFHGSRATLHRPVPRASATAMVAAVSSSESTVHEALSAALVKDRASTGSEMDMDMRMMSQMLMAKDAVRVIAEMDIIDMRRDLQEMVLAKEAAKIAADMHAARASMLARENDELATRLRRSAPGSYGRIMPFTHSLAHCVAHGRDAMVAARRDLYFERLRAVDCVKTAIKDLAFKWMVIKLRVALRVSRKLASWKASLKAQRALWQERGEDGALLHWPKPKAHE